MIEDMIHPSTNGRAARRGAALLIAMVALTTIAVIGAAFLRLGISTKSESNSALDQDRAFYISEAAIAESSLALAKGRSGGVATQAAPAQFGNGLFWVTSADLGNGDYQLDATAMCDSGRSSIRAIVHQVISTQFKAALISDQTMNISSNALVDSYDPSLGSYASQPKNLYNTKPYVNKGGNIRSNAGIQMNSQDVMLGNVTPGPTSSVTGVQGSTFINGSTAAATAPIAFPPVTVPVIASMGAKSVKKSDPVAARTLVAGNYHFTSLTLQNQAAFTIQGPASVVVDAFTSNSGCSLAIDATNGPVNVYFTGASTWVSNMNVTSTSPSARSVSVYFTSSNPVNLASNANLIGTIYAPFADVQISSNWVVYGAIMAKSMSFASNFQIHYDESLAASGRNGLPAQSISSWIRMPLPMSQMGKKRSDPFALLGVAKTNCPYPANAWQ
jgi:hypothetical protein